MFHGIHKVDFVFHPGYKRRPRTHNVIFSNGRRERSVSFCRALDWSLKGHIRIKSEVGAVKPVKVFLLTVPRQSFLCGSFLCRL